MRHSFVDEKTMEQDNIKIKISPNRSCTILLFKASEFVQIFFSKKNKF